MEDFSGLPYLGCFFNCAAWTFYGLPLVIEGGTLVVTINGAGAALFFTFVLIFLIFSRGKERVCMPLFLNFIVNTSTCRIRCAMNIDICRSFSRVLTEHRSASLNQLKVGTLFVAVIAFLVVLIVVTLTTVRQNQRKTVVGSTALAINIIMYSAPLSNTVIHILNFIICQ